MCQNTNSAFISGCILTALLLLLLQGNAYASAGSDLANDLIKRIHSVSNEQEMKALLQKANQDKSHLSTQDQIDYAERVWYALASSATSNDEESAYHFMMLLSGGIGQQEIRAGRARLLASDDPAIRKGAENLDSAGNAKLANGEMGQDMSVFDLALHDPKVPQDHLIAAMFKLAPVESAEWFADHAGLSTNERAGLESDLQNAWKLHRALNDPRADKVTKAMLTDSVKNQLLDNWLHSSSWILRSMANGLLQKRTELQTPDLTKAMQPVQVPAGLQITSTP
jgi:hypothetical protein